MTEKQGIDLSTSKGRRQAGGRRVFPAPVWRRLVVYLVVLIVATSAPLAGAFAAPSDDDPAGGDLSPDGATFSPGQENVSAKASSTGDAASNAWFVDPGEWYAPSHGPSAIASTVLSGAAGDMSAWFADQGEWHVAPVSPSAIASTVSSGAAGDMSAWFADQGEWHVAPVSPSAIPSTVLPGAAGDMSAWFTDPGEWHVASFSPSATASNARPDAAGSYSVLRLAAAESGAAVANTTRLSDAAGSYGVLRLAAAAGSADAGKAVLGEEESVASLWQAYERTAALSDSCMEQQDDPVFAASSAREAEYYDFQCSPKGAAGLIGGGGAHRQ